MSNFHTLLVATVGGTPDPIAVSLAHWRPARALFIASPASTGFVPKALDMAEERFGFRLPPGADVTVTVPAEDVAAGIRCIRERGATVREWLRRGDDYRVVVDITGGTKAMTAALSLAARQWNCTFSYIGGTDRTKDGVGIVVSEKERVLYTDNPWNALGYQAVEEAILLFNRHAYAAAASILKEAESRTADKRPKQELLAFHTLCEMLDAWDRFQPGVALKRLNMLHARHNDLAACLGARPSNATTTRSRACTAPGRRWRRCASPRVGTCLILPARRCSESRSRCVPSSKLARTPKAR
ncbi:hypothetical protein BH23GEM3_BH23GEM3_16570 [soil metagenome]